MTLDEDGEKKEEPKEHKPSDQPIAAIKLQLAYPEIESDFVAKTDDEKRKVRGESWTLLRKAKAQVVIATQCAVAEAITLIRQARAENRSRFPSKIEYEEFKKTGQLPADCFDLAPFHKAIYDIVKARSGFTDYWAAEVAQAIRAEFNKKKLRELITGTRYYPDLRKIPLRVRGRNVWYSFEDITKTRYDEKLGKEVTVTYTHPIVTVSPFFPKGRRMRLVCRSLHGKGASKGAASTHAILEKLTMIGMTTEEGGKSKAGPSTEGYGVASGWHKGSMQLVEKAPPGEHPKWFLICPYGSPVRPPSGESVLIVHRGVRNALVSVAVGPELSRPAIMSGSDIVDTKKQFFRRRTLLSRSIATSPHRGRGNRAHYKALHRLSNSHARYIDTAVWKLAKFVQVQAERTKAKLVIIESFSKFPSNAKNHYLKPYVRQFPIGLVKQRIIDVCTRRLGLVVAEISSAYNAQTCPACDHVAPENVAQYPSTSAAGDDGKFRCVSCGYTDSPDNIAILNLAFGCTSEDADGKPYIGDEPKKQLRKDLKNMARFMARVRKENRTQPRKKKNLEPSTDGQKDLA